MSTKTIIAGVAAAIAMTICVIAPSSQAAIVSGPNPCAASDTYGWMGDAVSTEISVPSLTKPYGIESYEGLMLKPADTVTYPGERPIVVIQHGRGGDECAQWWLSQELAGHGFVTLTWNATLAPGGDGPGPGMIKAIDATRSAIAYSRSDANPNLAVSNGERIAIAGSSLGSIVTSLVQGDEDPGVRAGIALDNIRHWIAGDPGADGIDCLGDPSGPTTPRVPVLGFAMDAPCDEKPDFAPADLKLSGFLHWRDNQVPSMELVMAGFEHTDFARTGDEQQRLDISYFILSWLDLWVRGDGSAIDRLLSRTVNGRPTATLLSTRFLSAAYLPPRIDTVDYLARLNDVTPPVLRRVSGPKRKVKLRQVKKRGVTFRFKGEAGASFVCSLDGEPFAECKSPRKIKRIKVGRHRYRVKASDWAENTSAPVVWHFRVVRR